MFERQRAERQIEREDGVTARGERPPPGYLDVLERIEDLEGFRTLCDCHRAGHTPKQAAEAVGVPTEGL